MIESWPEYKLFEKRLIDFVESAEAVPKIKRALSYVISAGGKRVRPLIVLISGKMCGGGVEELMNLAISVELIHTASLIHDDIIDRAEKRRRRDAVHRAYDLSLALVLGDWLISKSVELTSVYGEEVIREFSKVGMMMCEGEILDVYSTKDGFGEDEYFECIEKKTAALFAYSAKTACMVACGDEVMAARLFDYGRNLGIAYQMVDDLLEYLDVLSEKSSQVESRTILHIYEEKYGKEEAIERVRELISEYASRSRKALEPFEGEERKKLEEIVEYMTSRLISEVTS